MMYMGYVDDRDFTIIYDSVVGETGSDGDLIYLFNDEAVNVIASALPLYTPGANIYESGVRFSNILDTMSNDFWVGSISSMPYDESTVEYDIDYNYLNTYMMLDPSWSNDVEPASTPRVQIAQGQSDITRHESYFKKELAPNYEGAVDIQEELENLMVYLGVSNVEDITFVAIPGYAGNKSVNVLSLIGQTDPRTGNQTTIVFNSIPDPDHQSGVVRPGYGCYLFEIDLPDGTYPFDYSLTSPLDDEFTNTGL